VPFFIDLRFQLARALWRCAGIGVLSLAAFPWPVSAQQQDRERAQLLMLQQQMQRLQQENSSLKAEKSDLEQNVDALKKKSESAGRDLSHSTRHSAELQQQVEELGATLAGTREALEKANAENERLRSENFERDQALRLAGDQALDKQRHLDREHASLVEQTARADWCERKHAGLLVFADEVMAKYEKFSLSLSGDPMFDFATVAQEKRLQDLRDRLFDYRLDVKPPEPPHAGP
jgi:septal ring factor EnvC (AmiA/AmiB activator)